MLVAISISLNALAGDFSGELTYKISIIAKSDSVKLTEEEKEGDGETFQYLITSKFYKASHFKDGKHSYAYTYHGKTKFMYDDHNDQQYITYRDSRKGKEDYIEPVIYKDSIMIVAGKNVISQQRLRMS